MDVVRPVTQSSSGPSRSRSSTKLADSEPSLTSFNPFSEEDENDQSSYALMSSLLSKVRSTFSAPLSSTASATPGNTTNSNGIANGPPVERRRPSNSVVQSVTSAASSRSSTERPNSLTLVSCNPAPPLVSLTPVVSEAPSFNLEFDGPPSRSGFFNPSISEGQEGGLYGTSIPGFPIQDDARSIKTATSVKRSASASKVIRRIRGEGLSRDYWMDDENCKECYDCKSVFTTWRRKHHCRICGQIFCSRCASNIIKGSRYGHDGMIRICNLCLEKLSKVEEEDDDDRRSIVSSTTSPFAAHQLGADNASFGLGRHPQSPFAASQLFGRTDEPFNLFSIAETKRPISGSDESGFGSRPITPSDNLHDDVNWAPHIRKTIAPFRRGLVDDEKDGDPISNVFSHDNSPTAPGSKTPIDFPVTMPIAVDGNMSSIQFPASSPDHGPDSPGPPGLTRSRFNSYAEFEAATPFIRSRVQSRLLDDAPAGEPGWRTRRESTAYAQELNLLSMFHLRLMIQQMLTTQNIPNAAEWEETLLKLALRIARELTFTANPQRQGTDMDVRRYVKIKKIPGGAPKDSEYVDGAVITKNVAHKSMSRSQRNPRVMLITFPLEFNRVEGQYMHFGQIVRQEKEYLGNLASRISALRPHVILVEKSVSRLALEALAQHHISVARSVKPSAIQFVSRMTQGDVFSSMDKLALEPRLGHCARFRIQTFDHPLIPGRRKTFMRFEGCNREMGCTIILRGGDMDTLRRVKKVTSFLTFIVRNLKLETHLWKDSVITLPSLSRDAVPPLYNPHPANIVPLSLSISQVDMTSGPNTPIPPAAPPTAFIQAQNPAEDDLPDEDADQLRLSRRIQESLESYLVTFISVSATLRFPPPYPIRRMKELDDELIRIKRAWEDEVVRREERRPSGHLQEITVTPADGHSQEATITPESFEQDDINAQIESLACPGLSKTPTPGDSPAIKTEEPNYFTYKLPGSASQTSLVQSPGSIALRETPDQPGIELKTSADIALESQLSFVQLQHQEQQRVWEWYLRKNGDDFVVEKYQFISLSELTLPVGEYGLHPACFPPSLRYLTYYGENDCTLGQFIESAVADTLAWTLDPKKFVCAGKGCTQPMARHCKVYVHNETRLFMAVEQWDGQIIGRGSLPAPELITTWSACRICGSATPFIPVSEEMQRYSFAKFLELHFYPADVQLVQGAGCQHNIYQHHIRYFAIRGMTVRFQADPIILHEVVYPPMRIRVRPETQLELKNSDYQRLLNRNADWYTALIADLKLINIDAATGDEETDSKLTADINVLILRAEAEKNEVATLLNNIYRESAPTDTLALNQVRSFRQDKIVAWQADFDRLPKPKGPPLVDKNGRRVSAAFGSVRAMWPRRYELSGGYDNAHMPSSSVSEAEESLPPPLVRRVTSESFASSSASEASEPETSASTDVTRKNSTQSEPESSSPMEHGAGGRKPQPGQSVKSDPDSDSTIGASKADDGATKAESSAHVEDGSHISPTSNTRQPKPVSRLPRRAAQPPSVAELVKKYQDFLPAHGMEELAKSALSPGLPMAESDQESIFPRQPRQPSRHKSKHIPARKASTSDFEQSYAANIAPRYLTHRRPVRQASLSSRIPGPITSSLDSQEPSRQPSPEKRPSTLVKNMDAPRTGRTSPPPVPRGSILAPGQKAPRPKSSRNPINKDKAPSRPTSSSGPKPTFRRASGAPGSKVSNIAKHFERINRDTERANRRYAVIRGRRARPVASARAKVEVLDSVKDAIMDESESSDSSSEADDEGGDEDDTRKSSDKPSPESSGTLPSVVVQAEPEAIVEAPSTADVDLGKIEEGVPVPSTSDPLVAVRDAVPSIPPSPLLSAFFPPKEPMSPPPSDLDIGPGQERHSLLKALSGFWPQQYSQPRNRVEMEGDDPMTDPEHIFRDSSMVVRTDEPTSIIALALNSPHYREMLARSRAEKRQSREPKVTDGGEAFMPDDRSVAESNSTWGVVNVETTDGINPSDELRVPSSKLPWAITFESGGLTISCTVLYPEQFDALRRTYDCEKSMIESLARCIKWDASGGKSGSAFLKTRDDRFIAKEMSRAEVQTMETFAPAYFDYMSSAVSANRPTLLAKVFGCYKITFKKTGRDKGNGRSKSTQMNLLVMENLFYDRRFSKIYDLKGSTRNRHVQSTGRENEVLLDENLVQDAHIVPFYLREHSKRILRGSLYNDSKFLADINVMDYSLVVGVDSVKNELVVGIVDYVRTYTWDKKLESWVKESAFMGGAGKGEPTIVTPKQYRQRFTSAMERYFPLVPDRWMKQKDAPEDEGNSLLDLWPDW
ncbi:hypothetical protein EVG20_g1173 [Dentipellis fragilis]|uniref:1-phosphatidylinositol-3-phosphate 5-kinase n=1 Tax=Dentipellis fragilis TaxID=205917 RepID=A0A4Y9ZB86_9AGAM|nr:hypothetical protein EVG20_g1173 [Dentipellis fragilis]